MAIGLTGFVSGYSQSAESTKHRIKYRNIAQGGNHTLLAGPLAMQSMWAGFFLADVARIVMGPLSLIAQIFRVIFHPLISFPLSFVSSAVKSGLYESSVSSTLQKQTKYFARGKEVAVPEDRGSVTLEVDGQKRHYMLGNDVTYEIENSTLVEEGGKTKRYFVYPLSDAEAFDDRCREIEWKGKNTRVRLSWEVQDNYVKRSVAGETRYFRVGNEVSEPVQGTVSIRDKKTYTTKHYLIGAEMAQERADCIKIKAQECPLYYDTGVEIDAPTDTSRSFVINGTERHFASAKYNPDGESLGLSGVLNKIPRLPIKLPTRLSRFAIRVLHFVNANMSNIVRVALVSASVALVFFGHTAMAAGAILAVSYEYLNHDLGVIPRKVALFMERWMPSISMVGLLLVGSFTTQITAGATLLLTIPSVNLWMHHTLSSLIRNNVILRIKDVLINKFAKDPDPSKVERIKAYGKELEAFPLLGECDAPLVTRSEMTFQEIEALLKAEEGAYEINPAHLTKDFRPAVKLPENHNFSELIGLWEKLGAKWIEPRTSERLFRLLIDDQRFLQFMQKRFPEAKIFHYEKNWRFTDKENREKERTAKENHDQAFQAWIQTLAKEKGVTKEEYIADWVKQQLQHYVNKLTGKRPIEGEHRFLDEAIQNTAKLLPFLLDSEILPVHLEDALVNLAINAGDYCALGSWRTSRDVLEGFTEPLPQLDANGDPLNAQEAFANNVRLALQKARLRDIDSAYRAAVWGMRQKEELRDTADDVHMHLAFTKAFKRGFYPLDEYDMREFTLTELMLKETALLPGHVELLKRYKTEHIAQVMRELGIDRSNYKKNHVLSYLRTWVQESQVLTKQEKRTLLEGDGELAESDDNLADLNDNYTKWNRLMLTILGVMREKRS